MRTRERRMLFGLMGVALAVAGCASQQPLSNYARTGDTVMVSLGGTSSNALVPVLAKKNITVSLKEIFPSTTGSMLLPPVDCGKTGTWSTGPYYSTNLGWTPPLSGTYAISGSWAADVQNNLAVTQKYYGGDYYDVLGPLNYLSGASDPKTGLESLIQTAPAGADYYPIGVLR